jgi:UDP-N-acetylglucosamine 2-epimerase (non-hydrolysing)
VTKTAALIVGTRPQFVKTAPLILELGRFFKVVLIHTGQHYDFIMSENFFGELQIPDPDYHLETAGDTSGQRTGKMIESLEAVLSFERPDVAIVVGDTDSTLAGALAAAKLGIPLVHVEAGVRSKNKNLPEQINRLATDSISDIFMCPTQSAVDNLKAEGRSKQVFDTGDVIYDCLRLFEAKIPARPARLDEIPPDFVLATIHRAEAVDCADNLKKILISLGTAPFPVIGPAHPRTKKMLAQFQLSGSIPGNLTICEPLGYLDILSLVRKSRYVVTDSGGIQRESVYLRKQVVVARPETEWVELEKSGWVIVAGYAFELPARLPEPQSGDFDLDHLARPASAAMAELMHGVKCR